MNLLNKIVTHKKKEVSECKELYPVKLLERSLYYSAPVVSLVKYLKRTDKYGIIAEFKRKSPSKGIINAYADIEETSISYMQAGASALSILTDSVFFNGKNQDLQIARKFNFCPILRKDFIIDQYQVIEARSIGADAILLIAEILTIDEVKQLSAFAKSLNLEVLLEIHSESQISKICENIDIIGVNNRNLENFETNIETSLQLMSKLPDEKVKISESGLNNPETVCKLKSAGFNGFLIGEYFMKTAHPGKTCRKFINDLSKNESCLV